MDNCVDRSLDFIFQNRLLSSQNDDDAILTVWVNGVAVEDSCLASELASNQLDITVSLPGGKVHGSLARAGKLI